MAWGPKRSVVPATEPAFTPTQTSAGSPSPAAPETPGSARSRASAQAQMPEPWPRVRPVGSWGSEEADRAAGLSDPGEQTKEAKPGGRPRRKPGVRVGRGNSEERTGIAVSSSSDQCKRGASGVFCGRDPEGCPRV